MPHSAISPERAFARLHRLSLELHEAAVLNNIDAVNRVAELLPSAMEAVTTAGLPHCDYTEEMVTDIQDAFEEADQFLQLRMAEIRGQLSKYAYAKKLSQNYVKVA